MSGLKQAAAGEPLRGVRVAVTRPEDGAGEFADQLRREGAVPVVVPLVAVRPADDSSPLADAAARLADFDWVVFTSANAVRFLHAALAAQRAPRARPRRVAAVGPATAGAVAELLGWQVDVTPDEYVGDALTTAMAAAADVRGATVLWPRAEAARDALPRDLARAGARLVDPVAYSTAPSTAAAERLAALLDAGALDVLTFTSPSAVHALGAVRANAGAQLAARGTVVAVIGPSTAAAARELSMPVDVLPAEHTITGLVQALRDHFGARPSP